MYSGRWATTDEQALFAEFRTEYPDGKPVPEVVPQVTEPSELDRIKALEDALLMML